MNLSSPSDRKRPARRGATLVLAALMMTVMMGLVALAFDLGYVLLVRTQLQVAADSAAMSAAPMMIESPDRVVPVAREYANRHIAGNQSVHLLSSDVELGFWNFYTRTFAPSTFMPNAVRVTTRRDETAGGEAHLFFARALGIDSCAVDAEAIAGFVNNFDGFRPPPSGENLPVLPFALDKPTCDQMLDGLGTDDWTWDPETGQITPGPDGITEVNLYPEGTGMPGNRGTVDIGGENNATSDLVRQILDGPSSEDLAAHGGQLAFDEDGVLELNGDTGISTGIKDALADIRGEPRIICVFSQVVNPGDNALYTIVQFVGVRIMEVELTEGDKRVIIQPGRVVLRGGIPAPDNNQIRSQNVFSPICLVH
jgi:hypothetical protein